MASARERTDAEPWIRRARDAVAAGLRWTRDHPGDAAVAALAGSAGLLVIVYPFCVVHYPPITDLPFHASQTSILRHYLDDDYHFREQFSLHPLEVPYLSMWVLGALLALVLPIVTATKIMAIAMIALLPTGLAVLFHGMKKTPLWGVLGLGVVWTDLTHWGFLNFVGAVGLYAMSVGAALLVLDRPTKRRQIFLAAVLAAVFFTHVSRLPYALLSVAAAAAVMYPATRRLRPVVWPLAAGLGLLVLWRAVRPPSLAFDLSSLGFHADRLARIPDHLFTGIHPMSPLAPRERSIALQLGVSFLALVGATATFFFLDGRHRGLTVAERRWLWGTTALPIVLAAGFLFAYVVLPEQMGVWWYVHQREAVCAVVVLLAIVPDLPRKWWLRAPAVGVVVWAASQMSSFVAREWRRFDATTADFRAISAEIPRAPKLFYLVYDHRGSNMKALPFTHLPAWIQAEKGGWLSFHHALFRASPIRYREPGPSVPPPVPDHFEWEPQRFDVLKQGGWFDWFLIRHSISPDPVLKADPEIQFVTRRGKWWLYHRRRRGPATFSRNRPAEPPARSVEDARP